MAAEKKARVVPTDRAAERAIASESKIDPQGIDPEMLATIRSEQARRMKVKLMFGPGNVASEKSAGLMAKLKGMFSGKPKAPPPKKK